MSFSILPRGGAGKLVKRLLLALLGIYLAACAFLYFRQRHLIFFPEAEVTSTPATFGCQYKELWIPLAPGSEAKLNAWMVPAASGSAAARTLIYNHGNGGNLSANAEHACRLARFGFNVLIYDYRGYGKSAGEFPSEATVYADSDAAWEQAVADGARARDIVIYGHSLGGAVAIEMARRHPEAAGLVVESSFTSVAGMGETVAQYRIFPLRWLVTQRFDSITKVAMLRMPKLFIHGTDDEIVPFSVGQQLYAAAGEPKSFVRIPGAGHENCAAVGGAKYREAVLRFVSGLQ